MSRASDYAAAARLRPDPLILPDGQQLAEVSEDGGLVLTDPGRPLTPDDTAQFLGWLMAVYL